MTETTSFGILVIGIYWDLVFGIWWFRKNGWQRIDFNPTPTVRLIPLLLIVG